MAGAGRRARVPNRRERVLDGIASILRERRLFFAVLGLSNDAEAGLDSLLQHFLVMRILDLHSLTLAVVGDVDEEAAPVGAEAVADDAIHFAGVVGAGAAHAELAEGSARGRVAGFDLLFPLRPRRDVVRPPGRRRFNGGSVVRADASTGARPAFASMAFRVSREEGHAERAAAGIGQGTGQAPVDLGAVLIGNRATYEGESALGIGMKGGTNSPDFSRLGASCCRVVLFRNVRFRMNGTRQSPLINRLLSESAPLQKVAASSWGRAGRARSGLGRGGVGM